jgi:uncharacterized protein YdhG (YjbR/CyaY superfamily)
MKDTNKFKSVDDYFYILPESTREKLHELRTIIKETCPDATELISYNMPAFKYHGILVYYAAHKNHIGFYPANPEINTLFKDELNAYKTSKGAVQFPYDKTLPVDLIKKMVQYRMNENRL